MSRDAECGEPLPERRRCRSLTGYNPLRMCAAHRGSPPPTDDPVLVIDISPL